MVAGFATVAMMNAVSATAIGVNAKFAAATVQVLDGRDDPDAASSGASLRDRVLRFLYCRPEVAWRFGDCLRKCAAGAAA